MSYLWFGLGLSLIVALGTLLFTKQPEIEYKPRKDEDPENEAAPSNRGRRGSRDNICAICMTDIEVQHREFLPCFHFFHSKCIRVLRFYDKHCPMCRTAF